MLGVWFGRVSYIDHVRKGWGRVLLFFKHFGGLMVRAKREREVNK
jgi:hypothetical protein